MKQLTKTQIARLNSLMPNGIPKWIRIYDNGGETFDRYTCVFSKKKYYVGFSANPCDYNGFVQHGEGIIDRPCYSHLGKKIKFEDLNDDCKKTIINDYKDLWDL